MKILKIAATAAGLIFGMQANAGATVLGDFAWDLSNLGNNDYGIVGSGVKYDFEGNGANVKAIYSTGAQGNDKFSITGKAFSSKTQGLVDINLNYDDIVVNNSKITSAETDVLGTIAGIQVTGKTFSGRSLSFDATAQTTASLHGWFMSPTAAHFADIHAAGVPGAPITSAVSESATGLAFLGVLGVLAFGTRRMRQR